VRLAGTVVKPMQLQISVVGGEALIILDHIIDVPREPLAPNEIVSPLSKTYAIVGSLLTVCHRPSRRELSTSMGQRFSYPLDTEVTECSGQTLRYQSAAPSEELWLYHFLAPASARSVSF